MKDGKFESLPEAARWREFYVALLQGRVMSAEANAEMADKALAEYNSRFASEKERG